MPGKNNICATICIDSEVICIEGGVCLGDGQCLIVSPDESRGYLGFSTVTPPPQRFPFGRDNLKNNLVRTFKLVCG